jgi:hypothetical protein
LEIELAGMRLSPEVQPVEIALRLELSWELDAAPALPVTA